MKKGKMVTIISFVMVVISLSGCSSGKKISTDETLADGTMVTRYEWGDTYIYKALPATMYYNDKKIVLESIDAYESYNYYEYDEYVVMTLDFSDLTDKDIHRMDEEESFEEPYMFLDEGLNEFDSETMQYLGNIQKDKKKYYFFYADGYKESCTGTEVQPAIYIKQDETYNYKGSDEKKTNSYYYFDYEIQENVEAPETMDDWLYEAFNEHVQDYVF